MGMNMLWYDMEWHDVVVYVMSMCCCVTYQELCNRCRVVPAFGGGKQCGGPKPHTLGVTAPRCVTRAHMAWLACLVADRGRFKVAQQAYTWKRCYTGTCDTSYTCMMDDMMKSDERWHDTIWHDGMYHNMALHDVGVILILMWMWLI